MCLCSAGTRWYHDVNVLVGSLSSIVAVAVLNFFGVEVRSGPVGRSLKPKGSMKQILRVRSVSTGVWTERRKREVEVSNEVWWRDVRDEACVVQHEPMVGECFLFLEVVLSVPPIT